MTPLINHRMAGVEVEAAVEEPAEVVVAAVPAQVVAAVVEPARVVVVLGSEPVPVLVVGRPPAQTQSPR